MVLERYACEAVATEERIIADGGHACWNRNALKDSAPPERPKADGGQFTALCKGYGFQAGAFIEGPLADGGQFAALCKGYGFQAATLPERIIADGGHARRDRDVREAAATVERRRGDEGATRDHNGFQGCRNIRIVIVVRACPEYISEVRVELAIQVIAYKR